MTALAGISSWWKRRILGDQRARWNHQYATGRWDQLRAAPEQARFAAGARLLHRHTRGGCVLELGCGEGLLQAHVAPDDHTRWVGVDLSEVAVAAARARANNLTRYVAADMTVFEPNEYFDAIVFSESIYYVSKPADLLRRYGAWLNPGGVFVISIFTTKRSNAVWEQIHAVADPVDSLVTTNALGTWICEVLRLR